MAGNQLTAAAHRQNVLALCAASGLAVDDAEVALSARVLITVDPNDECGRLFAGDLLDLLERTIEQVSMEITDGDFAAEVVVGAATAQTTLPKMFVSIQAERMTFGSNRTEDSPSKKLPRILLALGACYASAAVLSVVLGDVLSHYSPDPLVVEFAELGVDLSALANPFDIGHAYLAGAGAIGNGLLWAARHLNIRGRLEVVDDDSVDSGNLNRQIFFRFEDIGLPKSERLVANAQPFFASLQLCSRKMRLQNLPERSDGPWLKKLIVAVDSRRARRELQNEFPREVFDASTTDIREVVLHYNRQPTSMACLSCIYEADEAEYTREQQIAEHLGVSVDEVRTERIDAVAAARIAERFEDLQPEQLLGTAYDSLFKQLCSTAVLGSVDGRRVVAPFAFVSCLAGTLLAIELFRRHQVEAPLADNYWRLSAWHAPLGSRRQQRAKQTGCEFCGNGVLVRLNKRMWDDNPIIGV